MTRFRANQMLGDDDEKRVRRSHGFARAVLEMVMAPNAELNPDEVLMAMSMVIGCIIKYHWRQEDWTATVAIILSQIEEMLKDDELDFDR